LSPPGRPSLSGPPDGPIPASVGTFINAKRLATWQSAALLRTTGWTEDKIVSEDEFLKALAGIMTKRQGQRR
jgi:hypothetical protein